MPCKSVTITVSGDTEPPSNGGDGRNLGLIAALGAAGLGAVVLFGNDDDNRRGR